MRRRLEALTDRTFDLLVIGGGIHGAWIAWDAALRGLDVSLVDAKDFAGATSSNSLKVVHGGLRYLQKGDIRRMRESIRERSILLSVAPHLVRPLPFMLPLYGHGTRGPEAMRVALALTDAIGTHRNRGLSPDRTLPPSRILSSEAVCDAVPGINARQLTGGALWYDALVYSDARLVIDILTSAVIRGATVANYLEAVALETGSHGIYRVNVNDALTGSTFKIQARAVVNATGPWSSWLDRDLLRDGTEPSPLYAKSINLAVPRLFDDVGVGFKARTTGRDRYLFAVPFRDHTLIGTTQVPFRGSPTDWRVTQQEIEDFIQDFNSACPASKLTVADVKRVYAGLVAGRPSARPGTVELESRYTIQRHRLDGASPALITVEGVKLTTARAVAERAVDEAFDALGYRRPPKCRTSTTPIAGAFDPDSPPRRDTVQTAAAAHMTDIEFDHLVRTYGARAGEVLDLAQADPALAQRLLPGSPVLKAEIVYAVQREMAVTVEDVLDRRTGFALDGPPNAETVRECEAILSRAVTSMNSTRTAGRAAAPA